MDNLDTKKLAFFKKFISFEPLKQQDIKYWGYLHQLVIFFPIIMIVVYAPTIYMAYTFGNGTYLKTITGKLDYIQVRKQGDNNLVVYQQNGKKQIGAGSVKPCGSLWREDAQKYVGIRVIAWYKNNAIYQLQYESNNQLVIPECNIQNNVSIYKRVVTQYIYYCIIVCILSFWLVYNVNKIISAPSFLLSKSRNMIAKIVVLYGISLTANILYFGSNFYSLYSLLFSLFN